MINFLFPIAQKMEIADFKVGTVFNYSPESFQNALPKLIVAQNSNIVSFIDVNLVPTEPMILKAIVEFDKTDKTQPFSFDGVILQNSQKSKIKHRKIPQMSLDFSIDDFSLKSWQKNGKINDYQSVIQENSLCNYQKLGEITVLSTTYSLSDEDFKQKIYFVPNNILFHEEVEKFIQRAKINKNI